MENIHAYDYNQPLISMLITIVRRASCMNACNIKHVWYCKHSCSWLDKLARRAHDERSTSARRASSSSQLVERSTSARRALVEHTSSTHQAHQAMSTTRRPGLMSLMYAWCVLDVCSTSARRASLSSQLVEPASPCKRGISSVHAEHRTGRYRTMPHGAVRYRPVPCVRASGVAVRCRALCERYVNV